MAKDADSKHDDPAVVGRARLDASSDSKPRVVPDNAVSLLLHDRVRRDRALAGDLYHAVVQAVVANVASLGALPQKELAPGSRGLVAALHGGLAGEPATSTERTALRAVAARWREDGVDDSDMTLFVVVAAMAFVRFLSETKQVRFPKGTDRRQLAEALATTIVGRQAAVLQALLSRRDDDDVVPSTLSLADRFLLRPVASAELLTELRDAGLGESVGIGILVPHEADADGHILDLGHHLRDAGVGITSGLRLEPVPHLVVLAPADAGSWPSVLDAIVSAVEESGTLVVAPRASLPLDRVPHDYEQTRRNLHFAGVVPHRLTAYVDPALLQLCRILDAAPEHERQLLVELVLGPIIERSDKGPLDRLEAVAALGDNKDAAAALAIGERTVRRDVTSDGSDATIKELTGYDWNDSLGRMLLSGASMCRWLPAIWPTEFDQVSYGPLPKRSWRRGQRKGPRR